MFSVTHVYVTMMPKTYSSGSSLNFSLELQIQHTISDSTAPLTYIMWTSQPCILTELLEFLPINLHFQAAVSTFYFVKLWILG